MTPINHYHATLVKWLSELGISHVEEYPVGRWSLDVFLPELGKYGCGVEVDGPAHNKRKDAERDAQIFIGWGITIVRIPVGTKKAVALEKIFGSYD